MALEAATYLSQLVQTNPDGVDTKSQGDDHLRLIKKVLQNTFPNLNAAVTATPAQINALSGDGVLCPVGIIVMWSGAVANIPAGWKLCNGVGTISNGSPVPNMTDRFIVASSTDSGGSFNINQTGGSNTHAHTGTSAGHVLTEDQMPAHKHLTGFNTKVDIVRLYGGITITPQGGCERTTTNQGYQAYGETRGGNQAHSHGLTIDSNSNVPLFYAVACIIKN